MTATLPEAAATSPQDPPPSRPADPPTSAGPQPRLQIRQRLVGVDAARGAALLGMIVLHALYEVDAAGRPTWSYSLFSGRAAAMFALLAGVGIAFSTGRRRVRASEGVPTVVALLVRALLIGAIGLVLGGHDVVLESVVLPYYAIMFLLAIPLVFLPTWLIAMIGIVMALGMPAASHALRPHLPEPSLANPTFASLIDSPGALLIELSITGFYPALPWMAYICAGLVIGRLNLTQVRTAVTLLVTGAVLTGATSAVSSILLDRFGLAEIQAAQPVSGLTAEETANLLVFGSDGTTPTSTWWWLAVNARHTSTPVDLLSTGGIAIAVLGALLLVSHLTRFTELRWITNIVLVPLAAVGTMVLTLYAAHILFINSEYDSFSATTGCLVQIAAALLIGLAWYTTAGRGPLETIIATLSNQARQWALSRRGSARHAAGSSRVETCPSTPTVELAAGSTDTEVSPASTASATRLSDVPAEGTNAASVVDTTSADRARPALSRPPFANKELAKVGVSSLANNAVQQVAVSGGSEIRSPRLAIEITIDPTGQVRLQISSDDVVLKAS
jgi:uncharacterized membrane protein